MKLSLSTHGFESKPQLKEIMNMSFQTVETDISSLIDKLKQGYCFLNYYDFTQDTYQFIGEGIKKNHYIGSYSINIDLDHQELGMYEMYDKVEMKPTFCYESWSNSIDDKRYRFIYVFDEMLDGPEKYRTMYNYICCLNNLKYDSNASSPYQYMNGTSSSQRHINTGKVYCLSDFNQVFNNDGVNHTKVNNQLYSTPPTDNIFGFCPFSDKELEQDYYSFSFKDLFVKYSKKYKVMDCSAPILTDEDTPMIDLKDWYEIRRTFNPQNGFTKKLKDGEGRKHKLYINSLVRRLINPQITFDELVFSLVYEMCYYISNKDNPITKKEILSIANNALKADLSKFNYKGRKSMVNPMYVKKYGGTRREIANKANAQKHNKKKEEKYQLIGEFYDFNLTIQQNIDIMNNSPVFIEKGYKISKGVIKLWKKENNLTKNKTNE